MTESSIALPSNRIVTGDCLNIMTGWPPACCDLIFADPPYNIGYQYDQYEDKRNDRDYIDWTYRWIDASARLLKPTGSLYILIGDEYAAETRLHLKQLEHDRRLAFRNWIVWHYTFGQNCRLKFNRSHAHLFYCVGPAAFQRKITAANPPFTFNRAAVSVPSARQTTYADARANPAGKLPDDTWYLKPHDNLFSDVTNQAAPPADVPATPAQPLPSSDRDNWLLRPQQAAGVYFRPDEDTWYLSRLCGTFKERQGWHPCQLPEALLERIIRLSSNPGDLVFDPFVGSGTTLAVAARLGRRWLGCELSAEYADKALQRIHHVETTGRTHLTSLDDKGIERGKPKKKAEPHRSPHLRRK